MNVLLDEQTRPGLRELIGTLLARADYADIAVARIRLGAIDLSPRETGGVRRCRILLGRLEAGELSSLDITAARRLEQLRTLLRFIDSGRVEIRSAGMGAWLPDFSIFGGLTGGSADRLTGDAAGEPAGEAPAGGPVAVCILGAHYFLAPPVDGGPCFTCVVADAAAVRRARTRFDELWHGAHDVRPAVVAAITSVISDAAGG